MRCELIRRITSVDLGVEHVGTLMVRRDLCIFPKMVGRGSAWKAPLVVVDISLVNRRFLNVAGAIYPKGPLGGCGCGVETPSLLNASKIKTSEPQQQRQPLWQETDALLREPEGNTSKN